MQGDPSTRSATADRGQDTVGVVVPTTGRASVLRSVRSALEQTRPPAQVVVVLDGPAERRPELPPDERIEVVVTGGGGGAAAARNAGVRRLRTDFVAFLDDDDAWLATKLEQQVAAARRERDRGAQHVIVACRQLMVLEDGRVAGRWPRRLIADDQDVAEYLFTRREVRPGGAAIGASMLLCDLDLVQRVPFIGETIHEDWAWVLSAAREPGCRVVALPQVLLHYTQSGTASASAAISWRESMDWVMRRSGWIGARQHGDFLLSVTAPLALSAGDLPGLREVVRAARREGAPGRSAHLFITLLAAREGLRWAARPLSRLVAGRRQGRA